jgi:hypothetical protein
VRTVDIVYRYGASEAAIRPVPPDSDAALLRLEQGNKRLDLALGVFQHVIDIGHMSFFRDLRVAFRPGANRPSMSRVILIPRL